MGAHRFSCRARVFFVVVSAASCHAGFIPAHGIQVSEKHIQVDHFKPGFTIVIFIHYKPRIAIAILDLQWMKMIWCGLKIEENCHELVTQFHGNYHYKTLRQNLEKISGFRELDPRNPEIFFKICSSRGGGQDPSDPSPVHALAIRDVANSAGLCVVGIWWFRERWDVTIKWTTTFFILEYKQIHFPFKQIEDILQHL